MIGNHEMSWTLLGAPIAATRSLRFSLVPLLLRKAGMQHASIRHVDVAIVGAGSAGLRAFRAARQHTDSVVLIDGGPLGTTCARSGCMPSKLLIAAADAAHHASDAGGFGVDVEGVRVDGRRVMQRVRSERDRFTGFVVDHTESLGPQHLIRGYARFVDDHHVAVGDQLFEAKTIVIATGSSPVVLPFLQGLGDRVLVNDDIFDWEDLPESVAVFGPGVIGLELGQAMHRLGVRVRIFGKGGFVGPLSDPAVKADAEKVFGSELNLDTDADVRSVKLDGEVVAIEFARDGELVTERFDYVLAATGRRPNVGNLGLEHTGLELDARGVPVFDSTTGQTSVPTIFIAGDVNADRPLLHEAADEGHIAGTNAARYPQVEPGLRRSPLSVVFSDPQIAMIGTRYADLDLPCTAIGEVSFEDQGRSRVMRRNRGMLRVYADQRSGTFLGAEMLGPDAEHIGHLLAWAHQQELTVAQMLQMPFYHPVVEEGLRTALRDAQSKLRSLHAVA